MPARSVCGSLRVQEALLLFGCYFALLASCWLTTAMLRALLSPRSGPIVLEMKTYRYVGHSMSDPGLSYRSREEIDHVRKTQDPIEKLKNKMISQSIATAEELKEMEASIKKEVDAAVVRALAAPEPELRELFTDIYEEEVPVRAVESVHDFVPGQKSVQL